MALPDLLPAHFLSSSLHDETTLSAAFPASAHKAPSPAAKKGQALNVPTAAAKSNGTSTSTSTSSWRGQVGRSPTLPTVSASGLAASKPAGTLTASSSTSTHGTRTRAVSTSSTRPPGSPLPAPIGIPATRRRSPSAGSAAMRFPLASSPTHTPFCVTPVGGVSPRRGISPIAIPRTPSPGALPPVASSSSSAGSGGSASLPFPTRGGSPSPTAGVAGPYSPGISTSPTASKKAHKWGHFFNFDGMLGALDPNRLAAATAPEPVKAVVFGAETETGLSVCRSLIAARHYAITALTVDDSGPEADELREHGTRVVVVDMDSPASYVKELQGAGAVYLSSNVLALHAILHHQHEPKRTEIARAADRCQLQKAIKACSRAKVGHVVFRVNACGHEVVENVLGKPRVVTEVPAPDDLDKLGILHTVLHTTVPYNRITEWLEDSDRGLVLNVPVPDDTAMPLFAIEQTGDYVLAALRNPKKWAGREMHAISELMTPTQIAARLSKVSRRPVDTMHPTREEFMSFESHERLALRWDAWAQLVRHEYVPDEVCKATKHDVPDEMNFAMWMAQDRAIHRRLKF